MNVIQYSKIKDKKEYRKMLKQLKKLHSKGEIIKIKNTIIVDDKDLFNKIVEMILKSCNYIKIYISIDKWLR